MSTQTIPDITSVVNQSFFLTPLGGPQHPISYLDRFPDTIYTKTLDTHLVKLMYTLLGPSGVGGLRKNYLQARLLLEDYGIDTFDLDRFYGDPIRFGRILEETYDEDPRALISREDWQKIRVKDAAYRSRALDYVKGARAGNTPLGIHLVARSGLGHEVEVIENYKYIYDQLSDDRLDLVKYGYTDSTEEMTIVPRRDLPQGEIQVLAITNSPNDGFFKLFFPVGSEALNTTANIAYNATANSVRLFLEAIPSIGPNNVVVTGGPLPDHPVEILFTGNLGFRDVPQLQSISSLIGPETPFISIETKQNGTNQVDEVVSISPRDQRYLRNALEYIKPVTAVVTYLQSPGKRSNQVWNTAYATSSYREVVRYVTGQATVKWPKRDSSHWIEPGIERQAPRAFNDPKYHYCGFHNVVSVYSYTEQALADADYLDNPGPVDVRTRYPSAYIGIHSQYQRALFNFLEQLSSEIVYDADRILADYSEPLSVTASTEEAQLINGIYPIDYSSLTGVPDIKYKDDQFWSSLERTEGSDFVELDLGSVQAVNYIYFEASKKPYNIEISYDTLDSGPSRQWKTVTRDPDNPITSQIGYDLGALNPWQICENYFVNSKHDMIFTRYIRLQFTRRSEVDSPFSDGGTRLPYSIEVKNLRVARNVS